MNGKFCKSIINQIKVMLTAVVFLLAAVSVAFFLMLLVSSCFLPKHFFGMNHQQIMQTYQQLLAYLMIPWSPKYLNLVNVPMTKRAILHFADVKTLINVIYLVTVLAISSAIFLWRQQKRTWQLYKLQSPLQWLNGLLIVLGVMAIVSFDDVFVKLHHILFANLNWQFSPTTNPIILLFPDTFFATLFLIWWLLSIFFLSLLQLLLRHCLRFTS